MRYMNHDYKIKICFKIIYHEKVNHYMVSAENWIYQFMIWWKNASGGKGKGMLLAETGYDLHNMSPPY